MFVLSGNASQPDTATLALWCEFWEGFGSVYPTRGNVLEIKCFRNLLKFCNFAILFGKISFTKQQQQQKKHTTFKSTKKENCNILMY